MSKVTVAGEGGEEFILNRKHWRLIVDEATGKKWEDFTATKIGMVERTCEFMNKMKARGVPIRCIRLDLGGENIALEKRVQSVDWQGLQPVEFEFTSRDTPQHNSLAELGFPNMSGKARALMGSANVPLDMRGKVAIEAIKCAVQLDGLQVIKLGSKVGTRDELCLGSNPRWSNNLRTWGEAGVVKEGKNKKTGDRGQAMMFVGYATNREHDSVRMWNPETNGVVTTRDVIWLKRMFFEKSNVVEHDAEFEIDMSNEAVDEGDDLPPPLGQMEDDDLGDDDSEAGEAEAVDVASVPSSSERVTRSGRAVQARTMLTETMDAFTEFQGSAAELRLLGNLAELNSEEI